MVFSAKSFALFAGLILGMTPASWASSPPKVVAVDGILCDLVRTVASSSADVTCLIPPTGDPHFYRLKPNELEVLSNSSIIFHNGFDLTPIAKRLPTDVPTIAVAEESLKDYRFSNTRSADPHVWHDPNNVSLMSVTLEKSLKKVLPKSDWDNLSLRTEKAKLVLRDLSDWTFSQVNKIPERNRVMATEHRAFSHLSERFKLRELPMIESFETRGKMRPSDLSRISNELKNSGALALFPESIPPSKRLKRISRKTGIPITNTPLYLDGLAPGLSTIETATSNICLLVQAQGASCDKDEANKLASRWRNIN